MDKDSFIFTPGVWIGEGKISFSVSPEFIKFYTKWQITEIEPGQLQAIQTVEIQGVQEHVVNTFTFYHITPVNFSVKLENQLVGIMIGTGIREENTIGWEFRGAFSNFEGFEVYERQENGDYSLHAEYSSTDQFRTMIEGLIWKKSL
jgi:hypothetical protein